MGFVQYRQYGEWRMLIGTYQHNIDAKGRVIIPAKLREELGEIFYATKGIDGCIAVRSQSDWEALGKKLAELPAAQTIELRRFLFSGAAALEPDRQGRVLIPQPLREYAGLSKDVVIIGTGSNVEIWDSEKWNAYNNAITQSSLLDIMKTFGL